MVKKSVFPIVIGTVLSCVVCARINTKYRKAAGNGGVGCVVCELLGVIDDSIIPVFDEKRYIASEKHFIVTM